MVRIRISDTGNTEAEEQPRPVVVQLTTEQLEVLARMLREVGPAGEHTTQIIDTNVDVQRVTLVAWVSVVAMAVVAVTALVTRVLLL